ncbi:hypothetical protein EVG20_g2030 [Dentipellis fragilis]|uniref:Uncharacterized protein n=1 Tax=Dentipellis fragilis TaxID=205917 RepID=A0A4Y9ZAF3_9AGAM|nr:hypothetical protein EVG20_g2030 [Dentipellis fragilis]
MLSSDWQHSVSGFRTAERIIDEPEPLPAPGAAGAGAGDGAGAVWRARLEAEAEAKANAERDGDGEESGEAENAEGEKVKEEGSTVRLVTEPSVLPAGNAFVDDIVSHLPYREIVTEEKVEVSDVMLDDSRILCLKVRIHGVVAELPVDDELFQRNQSGQLAGMDVLLF